MSNEVVFKIDLSQGIHQGTLPDTPENIAYNLNHTTVYLPGISGTFKNGDTITVSALESHKFANIPGVVSVPQVVSPPGNSFTPGGSGGGTNTSNNGVYRFYTSDNWTSPYYDTFIEAVCIGGGGGGSYLTGGGGGGSATSTLYAKSNTVFNVIIGNGGTGNPNTTTGDGADANAGSDGDDSYFRKGTTVLIRAKGGEGATNDGGGGIGGEFGIGDVSFEGGLGGQRVSLSAAGGGSGAAGSAADGSDADFGTIGRGGRGGSGSVVGGNGGDGAYALTSPGRDGQIPGGGGGGCISSLELLTDDPIVDRMGNGANGIVVVTILTTSTDTFDYTGTTQTWSAPQTGKFVARVWAAGAGGGPTPLSVPGGGPGGLTAGNSKAGGGGGGYSELEFTATSGATYTLVVGHGGTKGNYGGDSIFSKDGDVLCDATGGSPPVGLVGGIGGNTGLSVASTRFYKGGHGADVSRVVGASTSFGGGGGGSSGGTLHDGEDGDPFNGNTPGQGGILLGSDGIGGDGGYGRDNGIAGSDGDFPGGGGGGGGNNANSGSGANGRIEIIRITV